MRLFKCALIITLCTWAVEAQTLSNCRSSPPMQPNAKPGIGGLILSLDGNTLLVAAGDGKIRFVDLNTGEIKRTLSGHMSTGSSSRVDRTIKFWDMRTGQATRTITIN